jgi:acetyltransferase-like isoleucine patch superfamily enzyme
VINAGSGIAENVIINTSVSVDHDCVIGSHAHLAPGTVLAGGVTVGEHAFLGAGTIVIPGVRIGARVRTGAGAVVINDLPDGCLAVGVPARPR